MAHRTINCHFKIPIGLQNMDYTLKNVGIYFQVKDLKGKKSLCAFSLNYGL